MKTILIYIAMYCFFFVSLCVAVGVGVRSGLETFFQKHAPYLPPVEDEKCGCHCKNSHCEK